MSVIVPVRNDEARLRLCLAALADSTFREFEVIVADDASTDGTAAAAAAMGARVVRLGENRGTAAARNAAAEQARGEILLFVDADVLVHPDTLEVAAASLADPRIDAVFGSYDLEPGEPNLLSQYKNLAHRFYHQAARERATTFWTGCGAMRRSVFHAFGGFDAETFDRPTVEDIELGVRLTQSGRRILINKGMQAKHLKRWGLRSIFKSDVFDRAIPWTRLILRMDRAPDDLNLALSQRASALLSGAVVAMFAIACWFRPWLLLTPVAVYGTIVAVDRWTARRAAGVGLRVVMGTMIVATAVAFAIYAGGWAAAMGAPLLAIVLLNFRFYRFFVGHRGWVFTAAVLPMHLLYYLYSAAVFTAATLAHRGGKLLRRSAS